MNWLSNSLSYTLGAFVVWGFLMSLLFNVLMKFTKTKNDNLLLFCSLAMFSSYFISDHFRDLALTIEVYLNWFIYDVITLTVIFISSYLIGGKVSPGVKYVYIGLTLNSLLFLTMHIDTSVLGNDKYWWLWNLYSAGVNIVDFIMIFALILNKDYLGIIRFSKFITSPIRKKALS